MLLLFLDSADSCSDTGDHSTDAGQTAEPTNRHPGTY